MSTAGGQSEPQSNDSMRMILDYLERHGHSKAASQLRLDLKDVSSPASISGGGGRQVGIDDFADKNAPVQAKAPSSTGGSVPGTPSAPQIAARKGQGAQLLQDPPSWEKGYDGMRAFVENSLDIHRPEMHPILLPLFVHSYLDLVLVGYRDAADHFLQRFAPDHAANEPHVVRMLASIRTAAHVSESSEATRWRTERYCLRISERGWGLLVGWLQGGGLVGSGEGTETRGRDRMLATINERVKIEAYPGPPKSIGFDYGLLSEMTLARTRIADELKLGPAPIDPKLEKEVLRVIKEESVAASDGSQEPPSSLLALTQQPSTSDSRPPLVAPLPGEGPPYPATLRQIDVAREVEKVRETRKRIKLGPEAFAPQQPSLAVLTKEDEKKTSAAKPSVCLFTVHDAGDSLTTTAFSEDSTLMAAGFGESYVRLWSLKGEKLPSLRTDFDSDTVNDSASLKKLRLKDGPTSRKLIGHSGPVYSLSFDPVPGPSAPPRYLLSSSADATVRLWSLETYTAVAAYRGHRDAVWDVEWGPKGIYFATASRDKTARLWMSERTSAVRIFAGHLSDVNCVKFHPNSLYLATGSSDRTCRLWDVQRGTCVRVFVGHKGPVEAIALSPDGRYLASASEDLSIILWDLASGKKIKSLLGHTDAIYSLSFSAESAVLVSGSADGTVRAWDVLSPPPSNNAVRAGVTALGELKKSTAGRGLGEEGATLGLLPRSALAERDQKESGDLLCTMATKKTPVLKVHFTTRNLVLAAGPLQP